MFLRSAVTAVLLMAAASATPAFAQQSDAASANTLELGEILVTARKVTESLQDVPVAVSVADEALIERANIQNVFELTRMMPNVSFNQTYSRNFDRPAIRGQGNIVGARTVGLFIDGNYVPGGISSTDISSLERVEVLRGPQTALFGRGTLAGAINYVTKKPSATREGKVSFAAGSEGLKDFNGSISGPMNDSGTLRYLLSGRVYSFDGWYDNSGRDGGKVGQESTQAASLALYWQPVENFDATLRYSHGHDSDGIWPAKLLTTLNCYTNTGNVLARGGYYCGRVPVIGQNGVQTDFYVRDYVDPGLDKTTRRGSLDLNWEIGGMEVSSKTAWTSEQEDWTYDDAQQNSLTGPYRPTAATPGFIARRGAFWTGRSQELHLASSQEQRLRWLVGAFGYWEEQEEFTVNPTAGESTYTPNPFPRSPKVETQNLALFGRLEYDLTEQWTAAIEGRTARDEFKIYLPTGPVKREFDSTTPRVSLTWRPREDLTLYTSYAVGTRPGGINTGLFAANVPLSERERLSSFIDLDEEEAKNYEIGAKAWLFGRRLYIETAVFKIDWSKQQLTASQVFTTTANAPQNLSLTVNAGETSIEGLEVATSWKATENITVNGTYGIADAKFDSYCDTSQVPLTGDCSVAGRRS